MVENENASNISRGPFRPGSYDSAVLDRYFFILAFFLSLKSSFERYV